MGLTLNLAVACNSGDKVTAEHTPKESEKRGKEKEQKKMKEKKEKKEKKKSKKFCGSKMAKDFTTPSLGLVYRKPDWGFTIITIRVYMYANVDFHCGNGATRLTTPLRRCFMI